MSSGSLHVSRGGIGRGCAVVRRKARLGRGGAGRTRFWRSTR